MQMTHCLGQKMCNGYGTVYDYRQLHMLLTWHMAEGAKEYERLFHFQCTSSRTNLKVSLTLCNIQ